VANEQKKGAITSSEEKGCDRKEISEWESARLCVCNSIRSILLFVSLARHVCARPISARYKINLAQESPECAPPFALSSIVIASNCCCKEGTIKSSSGE
jgi:hypothetical protein